MTLKPARPRRAAKPPAASESLVQRAIIDWLRFRGVMAVHVPNGGKRSVVAGRRLKGEGMRPGFPDLVLYAPGGKHGLLEVKAETGRMSENQHECHDRLRKLGANVATVNSVEQAAMALRSWGWGV